MFPYISVTGSSFRSYTGSNKQMEDRAGKQKVELDVYGEGAWINAHHDPVASLYTFSTCLGKINYVGVVLTVAFARFRRFRSRW